MKTYNWEGVNPDGYFLDKLDVFMPPRFGGMKTYNWEGVNPDGYFLDKLEPIPSALPSFQKLFQVSARSEERRVGKECRYRWSLNHYKKNSKSLDRAQNTNNQ